MSTKKLKNLALAGFLTLASLFGLNISHVEQLKATVPYTFYRASLDSSGNQLTGTGVATVESMSKDGRFVVFSSANGNIVSGDTNNIAEIFLRDRHLGTNARIYLDSSGNQVTQNWAGIQKGKVSEDGRYVAFQSPVSLTSTDTNNISDIYVRDMVAGTVELVSLRNVGGAQNGTYGAGYFDMSGDGRFIVFQSDSTNLVTGDTNTKQDIFVRDRRLGTTVRVSVSDSGTQADNNSDRVSISCDGAYIVFNSEATNLVAGDANSKHDIFIVDRIGGQKVTSFTLSANNSVAYQPNISCDGSTVAFRATSTNLVSGDTNGDADVFTYTISSGAFERVSVSSSGTEADNESGDYPVSISSDGNIVAFDSAATNLVSGDTAGKRDVFVRDRKNSTTERVSMRNSSTETNQNSIYSVLSSDGEYIGFTTSDSGIVSGDTNGLDDVFIADTGLTICTE